MFENFAFEQLTTDRGSVSAAIAGEGPPLLLLHGFPETMLTWHAVAPRLAERFTVVVCDLPGYGDSQPPEPAPDHAPHSKRALARDLVQAMAGLGHDRFALAGHDRGGRVGYRMALDFPDTVTRLAVLDIVPTSEVWERATDRFAVDYWHWGFLAQPAPRPEEMLLAAPPETFLSHHFEMVRQGAEGYPLELAEAYLDRLTNPVSLQGMCEDYRAGATIDRELDVADRRAGRRIDCPLLALWGAHGVLPALYDDPLEVWRPWASDLRGHSVDATHYIPEDLPAQTATVLGEFVSG